MERSGIRENLDSGLTACIQATEVFVQLLNVIEALDTKPTPIELPTSAR